MDDFGVLFNHGFREDPRGLAGLSVAIGEAWQRGEVSGDMVGTC